MFKEYIETYKKILFDNINNLSFKELNYSIKFLLYQADTIEDNFELLNKHEEFLECIYNRISVIDSEIEKREKENGIYNNTRSTKIN